MEVTASRGHSDSLYVKAGDGAIINRRQVQELANRLNAWLGEPGDADDDKEWEDL